MYISIRHLRWGTLFVTRPAVGCLIRVAGCCMTSQTLASVTFLHCYYLLPIAGNFSTLLHAIICLWQVVLTSGRLKFSCCRFKPHPLCQIKYLPGYFSGLTKAVILSIFNEIGVSLSLAARNALEAFLDYPISQFTSFKFQIELPE